jgi:hypothetical protein
MIIGSNGLCVGREVFGEIALSLVNTSVNMPPKTPTRSVRRNGEDLMTVS